MAKATKLAAEKIDLKEIIEHQSEETNSYWTKWKTKTLGKSESTYRRFLN